MPFKFRELRHVMVPVERIRQMVTCAVCQRPVDHVIRSAASVTNLSIWLRVECHGERDTVEIHIFDLEVANMQYPVGVVTAFKPQFQKQLPAPVLVDYDDYIKPSAQKCLPLPVDVDKHRQDG